MLTVEDYAKIRIAKRDGMSIRAICRTHHHSHHTITKALENPQPRPYTRTEPTVAPVLGPFMPIIDQILLDDRSEPTKQRHKASKIYRRLRDEYGYKGGSVLLTTWSHSSFRFGTAFPSEKLECVLTGLVRAFEFFGCVARELWWDNPKTVVQEIFKGRKRQMNPRYAALASHYMFEPLFCMPAKANEKSHVENSVFDLQRDWATPVPKVQDYDELNDYLRQCCLKKLDHRVAGKTETVAERFEQDKAAALALPDYAFDPYVSSEAKVDKYQTVRFETNRYSVPRRWAFEMVTVKAYPFGIKMVASGRPIAYHKRCYGRHQQILEPRHYLAVLGRRPAALDHSDVFRSWQLPACFAELRERLERRQGPFAGARQYIRILQLLAEHPLKRIQRAVELCIAHSTTNAQVIINKVHRLAQKQQDVQLAEPHPAGCYQIQVPKPDLNKFDQYLTTVNQGEAHYV